MNIAVKYATMFFPELLWYLIQFQTHALVCTLEAITWFNANTWKKSFFFSRYKLKNSKIIVWCVTCPLGYCKEWSFVVFAVTNKRRSITLKSLQKHMKSETRMFFLSSPYACLLLLLHGKQFLTFFQNSFRYLKYIV